MWDNYKKAIQQRKERLNAAWEDLGKIAANRFVSEAKTETDLQRLVKTGNYRRNWTSDVDKKGKDTVVKCINNAEYASHLEYGHRIVTRSGIDTGRKTLGRFVGRTAINKTRKFISGTVKELLRKIFI
ncbi:MAG: HK97 gp10 family phage protein [Eubacterium sp.]|nr:HK97 gp10 family phage protein [Eubacterium sp.]